VRVLTFGLSPMMKLGIHNPGKKENKREREIHLNQKNRETDRWRDQINQDGDAHEVIIHWIIIIWSNPSVLTSNHRILFRHLLWSTIDRYLRKISRDQV